MTFFTCSRMIENPNDQFMTGNRWQTLLSLNITDDSPIYFIHEPFKRSILLSIRVKITETSDRIRHVFRKVCNARNGVRNYATIKGCHLYSRPFERITTHLLRIELFWLVNFGSKMAIQSTCLASCSCASFVEADNQKSKMEAVPRMPMVSFELKNSTKSVDYSTTIKRVSIFMVLDEMSHVRLIFLRFITDWNNSKQQLYAVDDSWKWIHFRVSFAMFTSRVL